MEHVVFHPGPDGTPGFRRFASLDEAVGFVEHLRNIEGVEDVSVHALTPVPVAFRAYYKVEVPAAGVVAAEIPAQPLAEMPLAEMPLAEMPLVDVPLEPVAESVDAVAANGKRSLGFFAH